MIDVSTILVIDDKADNLYFATQILQNKGYHIIEAKNGGDGIRIAKEEQPNLILMELQLPGLDGLTTTRLLKANPLTRHIKIIAQTALFADIPEVHLNHREKVLKSVGKDLSCGVRDKVLSWGAHEFIRKPYVAEDLLKTIENLLASNNELQGNNNSEAVEKNTDLNKMDTSIKPETINNLKPSPI